MAKANSPVRLQADLMDAAQYSGHLNHRSAAQQIEYWADLGRKVENSLTPQAVVEISSGLANLSIEQVSTAPINPAEVFNTLETQRQRGELADSVSGAGARYQIAEDHPGYLERIDEQGDIAVGKFSSGKFVVREDDGLESG